MKIFTLLLNDRELEVVLSALSTRQSLFLETGFPDIADETSELKYKIEDQAAWTGIPSSPLIQEN